MKSQWLAHLDLMKSLDPIALCRCYPELPTERGLFWAHIYTAIVLLTDNLPQSEGTVEEGEHVPDHWYVVRGKAEEYLGRHRVKLFRHTKQFEFRGRLYPVFKCLLEGRKVDDNQLRNLTMDEIRRAVAFKNHTLFADMTAANILCQLTDEEVVAEAKSRDLHDEMMHEMPWPQVERYLLGTPTEKILDCVSINHIAEYLKKRNVTVWTEADKQAFKEEWEAALTERKDQPPIGVLAAVDPDAYQVFTKTTWSSPADAERWNAGLSTCLEMIENLGEFIERFGYDRMKKFCAYNRLPAGLMLTVHRAEYNWHISHPDHGYRAAKSPELSNPVVELLHAMFGLITEVQELCEAIGCNMDHDFTIDDPAAFILPMLDAPNILEECGDLQYYVSRILDVFGYTMSQCLIANQRKLGDKKTGRYKDGMFSEYAANNRNLDNEQDALKAAAESCVDLTMTAAQQQMRAADKLRQNAMDRGITPQELYTETMKLHRQVDADILAAQSGVLLDCDSTSLVVDPQSLYCTYCDERGHLLANCPTRAAHLAESAQGDNDTIALTDEEIAAAQSGKRSIEEE